MNLRTARRIADLTQAQLARKAGVKLSAISDVETGRNKRPAWEFVKRVSDALGVDPHEIFPLNNSRNEAA